MALAVSGLSPEHALVDAVAAIYLVCLAMLGGIAAQVGGAPIIPVAGRVMFWGALAMAATAGVGALFGTQVKLPITDTGLSSGSRPFLMW